MRLPVLACAFYCLGASAVHAQGLEPDETGAPYFVVPGVDARLDPLPLREVAVHADISGVVADVTVTQLWENTGATPISATYVFPLSTRAAVHALEMRVGARRIVATIKERDAARKVYEDARRAGRTATLLEQQRPNMFTTEVANIQPGDLIEVELRYVELLRPTDGIYSLVVPRVVGPRYVSPSETDPELPWSVIASDEKRPPPSLYAWPVSVSLSGGVPVQWVRSPTHPIDSAAEGDRWEIELADLEPDTTSDFVLEYALGDDALETGVLVQPDPSGEGGHFLALIEPPDRVEPELVPARDYVFIVDTSGSMSGWPLAVATQLVGRLVDGLEAADRVNVLCFSGGSERLAERSLPATPANKARAKEFLARQQGQGGTELLQALELALKSPAEPGLARTFVLVTDGYVSVEAQAIDLIRSRAGAASVFAMGIGNAVNRHLLEAVAHAGRGEPYVAMNESDARELAERFFEDVRTPVLTDIALSFEGLDAYDVEPAAIPTLYQARPILVSGRYRGRAEGALTVTGRTGRGPWGKTTSIRGAELNPAVPLLWARERIARLSDFAGAYDAPDHRAEITALGLEYALVTRHTSFVAVAPPGAVSEAASPAGAESDVPSEEGDMGGLSARGSGQGFGMAGAGIGGSGSGAGMAVGYGHIVAHQGRASVAPRVIVAKAIVAPPLRLSVLSLPDRQPLAQALLDLFQRRLAALRKCLEGAPDGLAKDLTWELAIDARGAVTLVRLSAGTLAATTEQCLARRLRQVRLPAPSAPYRLELRLAP